MKKIYKILLLAAVSMATLSCSDFLEGWPTTQLSGDTVYGTEEALESQVYGCYRGFYGSYMYMNRMHEYLHTASGLIHWGKNRYSENFLSGIYLTKLSTDSEIYNCYANHYSAIYRCNALLAALKTSPVDEGFKTAVEAEVRFMRAVLYFTLVRMFGDVPLILQSSAEYTGKDVGRTPYYKVYDQIVADLEFAEENMRDKAEQLAVTGNPNRPNKWAATAYKSKVYLHMACLLATQNDNFFDVSKEGRAPDFSDSDMPDARTGWEMAFNTAKAVIDSKRYSLADKYTDLFRWTSPEDYLLEERIFVLESTSSVSATVLNSMYSLPAYPYGTQNRNISNSNWGRWRPSRWLFQVWCKAHGGELGTGDSRTANIYVNCADPRLDASMIHTETINNSTGAKYYVYPAATIVKSAGTESAHPYFKKYLDPKYNGDAGHADFYMLRLADIYLTAAEAAACLCSDPYDEWGEKAHEYVEYIHARARKSVPDGLPLAEYPTWEYTDFTTAKTMSARDSLIHAVIWEREFELSGEGHEFFDTHRHGATFLLEHVSKPLNEFLMRPEQQDYLDSDGRNVSGIHTFYYKGRLYPDNASDLRRSMICSFPRLEIQYNKELSEKDKNDFSWD